MSAPRTFTPLPARQDTAVKWPSVDEVVEVTDLDGKVGKAMVLATLQIGDGRPGVQVTTRAQLRLPISDGGFLAYNSDQHIKSTWRWPA